MELESQLGGLFSLLTVEFLVPYLNRKLAVMQRNQEIPKLPKGLVSPTIVAGINALGRGQDRESLATFLTTLAQTLGPEVLGREVNTNEAVKRYAAAMGIDVLNLITSMQDQEQAKQKQLNIQKELEMTKQIGQLAGTPMMDPSKNPQAMEMLQNGPGSTQPPQAMQEPPGQQPPPA
jgi:hypothetical protein